MCEYCTHLISILFQSSKYQTKKSVIVNLTRTPTTRSDPSEFSNEGSQHSNNSDSRRQISTYHVNASDHPYSIKDEPNILQVYAAYETGLGESYESFVRKRAHVKYQSQNEVFHNFEKKHC